jgi:hypothetical protein
MTPRPRSDHGVALAAGSIHSIFPAMPEHVSCARREGKLMVARRVTFSEHEEALAVCAKIKAKHPDILDRLPNGLYPYQVSNPEMGQVLYDYLAADRVAKAWAGEKEGQERGSGSATKGS